MKWFLYLPIWAIANILGILLAPILPLFAQQDSRLPRWLSWFGTPDNDMDGDRSDWTTRPVGSYMRRVLWLLRNNVYGFEWQSFLCATIDKDSQVLYNGIIETRDSPKGVEGYCYTTINNYWHLIYVKKIGFGRCLKIELGWKLKTYAEDVSRLNIDSKAQYVFSPRIPKFQE